MARLYMVSRKIRLYLLSPILRQLCQASVMSTNCNDLSITEMFKTKQHNTDNLHSAMFNNLQSQERMKVVESRAVDDTKLEGTRKHLKQVDFMVQTPNEIMRNILTYINTESVLSCINVSRAWRYKILQCPLPWRIITITACESPWTTPEKLGQRLPYISQHIEEVSIKFDSTDSVLEYLKLFCVHSFTKLWFLKIDQMIQMEWPESEGAITASVYSLLPYVAPTLTELHIDMNDPTSLSFTRVISICRNLTAITMLLLKNTDTDHVDVPYPTRLNLIHYQPYSAPSLHSLTSFDTILRSSPNLVSLHVGKSINLPVLLPTIIHSCPKLKKFSTNVYNVFESVVDYESMLPGSNGLEFLTFEPAYEIQRSVTPYLRSLIENNRTTLKHIRLYIKATEENISDWQFLSSTIMDNLVQLSIDLRSCSPVFYSNLPNMLRCYPQLETLRLESYYDADSLYQPTLPSLSVMSHIFDTIRGMEHLTHLKFKSIQICSPSFQILLQHHAKRNALRRLEIYECIRLTNALLQEVLRIKSLEYLGISLEHTTEADDEEGSVPMTPRFSLLGQLPQLSTLFLHQGKLNTVHDDAQDIMECAALRTLLMYDVELGGVDEQRLQERIPLFRRYV
ncbi:hypothetical protein BJV82DRAFT_607784 [Fennellomyces sp. T-0311]|nr:hypothetical protein BJV82DRAFT_607784 [Fennellomyces sp. T-0311]